MRNNKLKSIFLCIVFFLWAPHISPAQNLPPLTHSLTPLGTKIAAPSLQFQNLDEEEIDLRDFNNNVVVVNFWATWCPPCRREMGSLEKLYQATRGRNVEVLAVNIGEDIDTVFSFLGTVEPFPNFPILFDHEATSMEKWNVKGLPTTYIIAPGGNLAYIAVGGREFDHPDILREIYALAVD